MAQCVLDTSVVLAALQRERGAEYAERLLPTALLSSVNLGEVATKLAEKGANRGEVADIVAELQCEIVPFDARQALDVGLLRPLTRRQGLSFGDRACLALALNRGLPVYTAERAWADVRLGLSITLIR